MERETSEVDKLFSSLKDYEVPDKKDNWELMRHLLKEQRKKGLFLKKIKIASFTFITLIAAAGAFWLYSNSNQPTKNEAYLANKSNQIYNKHKENLNRHKGLKILDSKKINNKIAITSNTNDKYINQTSDSQFIKSYVSNSKKRNSKQINIPFNYSPNPISSAHDYKLNNNFGSQAIKKITGKEANAYLSVAPKIYKFSTTHDSVKVKVTKLSNAINSDYLDFGTVMTIDGATMYFTSNKPVAEKGKKKHKKKLENVYVSQFKETQKKWTEAKLLPPVINVPGRNNSVIGLSNDGQKMFLYRDDKGMGDIFESDLNGTQWSQAKKMPEPINSKYQESSASLSPDGQTIYFISDRPGGKGKKDIWYAKKENNGNWGKAVDLKALNTSQNEAAVFIAADNKTMYFSSKGYKGLGGYDIYKATFENGKWNKPVNLGKPINTAGDDIYFVLKANGTEAYYTSREQGETNNTNIYKVDFIPVKIKKEYIAKLTLFKGKVIDKETKQPMEAKIEISNLDKNKVITTIHSNSATGKFLVSLPFGINYGITATKSGYLFFSQNINTAKDSNFKKIEEVIPLAKAKKGTKITLHNIFFDYNKATLRSTSYIELNHLLKILKQNPDIKIAIDGYTDSKGSDSYNLGLSQARAQSVTDYLIKNGIDKERLVAKGYGEADPVAPNTNPDGTDNPVGRQLNRRIELKIL